jgi:hypothetical protein
MRRLYQDCAARLEPETLEAMSRQPSVLPRLMARHHEHNFFIARRFREQAAKPCERRDDKTERRWERRLRCRDHLMQRAAGKPTVRQAVIKCGKAESKRGLLQALRTVWLSRQQKTQFGDGGSTAMRRG